METLKLGSKGDAVKQLQKMLHIEVDGIFGDKTKESVMRYQLANNIVMDGVVGNDTWTVLLTKGYNGEMVTADTDIQNQYFTTSNGLMVHKHHLPKDQYIVGKFDNDYIFLHHTAGNDNPYATIDSWGRDTWGAIATEFVLGGKNHINNDNKYDGVMVQSFPTGNQGWHLGPTGSGYMVRHSVAIELCSMGYLDDKYRTYVNSVCNKDQVCKLSEPFRGKLYWHKYSDKQLESLEKWLKFVAERDDVDIRNGLVQWIKKYGPTKAFDFQQDGYDGKVKGLLTHANVRKDKMDCFPQPELIDMLLKL